MTQRPAAIVALRVSQLWVFGELLASPADLDWIKVALVIDAPPDQVPWLGEPKGAGQWVNATRVNRNPISVRWRSAQAPVWNHSIERPALVWSAPDGLRDNVIAAIRSGAAESVREPAPPVDEWTARMGAELAISMAALRAATTDYDDRRWRPGKLEPVADALWRAAEGYLDVKAALG